MANSKWEYVKQYELDDRLLPRTWLVLRVDGKGFHKFCPLHNYAKPNDDRGLDLLNAVAAQTVYTFHGAHKSSGSSRNDPSSVDFRIAYGVSDEYSFVFGPNCCLFNRRSSKISSTFVSTFTAYFTFLWPKFFPDQPLLVSLGPAVSLSLSPSAQSCGSYSILLNSIAVLFNIRVNFK